MPSENAERVYNVLFVCTGNSARSVIAEALMNRDGGPRFRGYSAGSMPKGEVNPHALVITRALGFEDSDFRSKSWEEFAQPGAPPLDFVITVCDNAAGEVCPVWPGKPIMSHWGVPDPADATGSDAEINAIFAETARMLGNRIRLLLSLPIAKIDAMSLQTKLREIHQSADRTGAAE